jgi:hypothetical protein
LQKRVIDTLKAIAASLLHGTVLVGASFPSSKPEAAHTIPKLWPRLYDYGRSVVRRSRASGTRCGFNSRRALLQLEIQGAGRIRKVEKGRARICIEDLTDVRVTARYVQDTRAIESGLF